jgi:hypothetical protein
MTQPQHPSAVIQTTMSTLAEARKLSDELMQVMTELLGIIEDETALVSAGKIRDAMALEECKTDMSRRYITAMSRLDNNQTFLAKSAPDLLEALHRHHDVFRAMLQVNLTVLATAHAVSEGIIRGVNGEMQRKNMPQPYTSAGIRTAPYPRHATPFSISRTT